MLLTWEFFKSPLKTSKIDFQDHYERSLITHKFLKEEKNLPPKLLILEKTYTLIHGNIEDIIKTRHLEGWKLKRLKNTKIDFAYQLIFNNYVKLYYTIQETNPLYKSQCTIVNSSEKTYIIQIFSRAETKYLKIIYERDYQDKKRHQNHHNNNYH